MFVRYRNVRYKDLNIFWRWVARKSAEAKVDNYMKIVKTTVEDHMPELVKQHRRLIVDDNYGGRNTQAFEREMHTFFRSRLGKIPSDQWSWLLDYAIGIVDLAVFQVICDEIDNPPELTLPPEGDGVGYEAFCEAHLVRLGWEVRRTRVVGDQGADLITQKDGRSFVFQCKHYKAAVGNGAVQEAAASRAHYGTSEAGVICSSRYTLSAQQLAQTNRVLLLHHDDLASI